MRTTELTLRTLLGLRVGLLVAVCLTSGLLITSCGSGGGSSDGGLCDQCGDDPDGSCQSGLVQVDRFPSFCPNSGNPPQSCDVNLVCRRRLGTSQRVCYPADPANPAPNSEGVTLDLFFECDGARPNPIVRAPGPTPIPSATITPSPTLTPSATALTPTPTPSLTHAPTPTPTPTCGDNMAEGDEECDGTDLADASCDDCEAANDNIDITGTPLCTSQCTLDYSSCMNVLDVTTCN